MLPDSLGSRYASKYSTGGTAKWDEPDTVYGASSDKKPYSKVETGSSFFSTYGYTNRKKDYVAEKVRDYYYTGDEPKVRVSLRFTMLVVVNIGEGTRDNAEGSGSHFNE